MSSEIVAVIASACVAVVTVIVHARLVPPPPEPGATDGEEDWQNR